MSRISPALRRQVCLRAEDCCEYCGLPQLGQEANFHVDHIIPTSRGGRSNLENLALSCVSCSLRKGAAIHALDPKTGILSSLFHPRRDIWKDHFARKGDLLHGRTPAGRATITLLNMNRPSIVMIRAEARMFRHRLPL
jgi:hypothetical protein